MSAAAAPARRPIALHKNTRAIPPVALFDLHTVRYTIASVALRGKLEFNTRQIVVLIGGGLAHTSGGVGTLMIDLLAEFAARPGAPRVRVIDTRGPGGVIGGIAHALRAAWQLAGLCLRGEAALVHAHMTTHGSAVRKSLFCGLASLCGTPSILHMHGADFMPFYRRLAQPWRAMLRATLRRAAHVVVLGEGWRDFVVQEVGCDPARVAVVLNGVRAPRDLTRRSAESPHIVFLGRMGDRKGVPELVQALAAAATRRQPWHATLAGDGEVARFTDMVREAGLSERVAVPGWMSRADTDTLLRSADMLVLPSHHEAMPMALIEAMAYRVPIVTTPVGAIGEFLRHDHSALLVPPGDPQALAAAMLRLLDDRTLGDRLAEAAYAAFRERFDIRSAAQRILELYDRAARPSRPGRTPRSAMPVQS